MPNYSFNQTPSGTVEVSQNGSRVATATPQYAAQQYGYLIPTIPNPPKSPASTAAVVTPEAAKDDLAKKQATVNAIVPVNQATQQPQLQTGTNGQPVNTGNGTQTNTSTTQNQPTTQPTTDISASTKDAIMSLLKNGAVLTEPQARLVAGTDFTGLHKQDDGTYVIDQTAVDRINQQNPTGATGTSSGGYAPTGNPVIDASMRDLQNLDSQFADYQSQVDKIRQGVITPEQQAQLDSTQHQFDSLKQTQKQATDKYIKGLTLMGIKSGLQQYAPGLQMSAIQKATDDGIARLADIDAKAVSSIATLKQGFLDNDYKLINDEYANLTKYVDQKTAIIKNIETAVQDAQKAAQDAADAAQKQIDAVQKDINGVIGDAAKNGAPAEVIAQISQAGSLPAAVLAAGDWLQTGTGIVGEYQFYKRDAIAQGQTPMSFEAYQNEDANRKAKAANVNGAGLNPAQTTHFIQITNKYQADGIMQAALKGKTAVAIADQVIADPGNAANQLKALYVLVKNLDPDSAVREGEISLANQTQSYLAKFATDLTRIAKGQVISAGTAKQLAQATKELAATWNATAATREKQYISQANNADPLVGAAFQSYLQDFNSIGTSQDLIDNEAQAQQTVTQIYPQYQSQIDTIINQNPGISNADLLQVLGITPQ